MPQLTSFWELLQAKSKQVQKSPCRPKPQQTSSAESPPSDSASRGAQRQGQTQKHQCPCIESFRKQSSPQLCPEPLPQRRRMRQCEPMSNTAPRASCSQGYHGPCTARSNPQRYLFGLLGYPHPVLRQRGLPYYPKSEGDGTSGNHSQCIRHRQLLRTGMVSPTYAYAAPSSSRELSITTAIRGINARKIQTSLSEQRCAAFFLLTKPQITDLCTELPQCKLKH